MFPAVHTLWLLLVVVALNIVGTVVILVQALRRTHRRRFVEVLSEITFVIGWDVNVCLSRTGIARRSMVLKQVARLAMLCALLRLSGNWLHHAFCRGLPTSGYK